MEEFKSQGAYFPQWIRIASAMLIILLAILLIYADIEGYEWLALLIIAVLILLFTPLIIAARSRVEIDSEYIHIRYWPLITLKVRIEDVEEVQFQDNIASPISRYGGIGLSIAAERSSIGISDGYPIFINTGDKIYETLIPDANDVENLKLYLQRVGVEVQTLK